MWQVRRRWLLLGVAGWACSPQEREPEELGSTPPPPAEEPIDDVSEAAAAPSEPSVTVAAAEPPAPSASPPEDATREDGARKEGVSTGGGSTGGRHHLNVPRAHVEAGASRSYTVFGDGHSHPITIDEAAMAKLKGAGFALVQCGLGGPDKPHRHWCVVHVA